MDTASFFVELDCRLQEVPGNRKIRTAQRAIAELEPDLQEKVLRLMPLYHSEGIQSVSADCVVVLIHGIRDQARWHDQLRTFFSESPSVAKTYFIRYGYFGISKFILHGLSRKSLTESVSSRIHRIAADHSSQRVILIAHSYGTYILSRLFIAGDFNNIYGVIFCGSIVPQHFDWCGLKNPLRAPVINECGTCDSWPLVASAIFPSFGAAGRIGFHDEIGSINRFHNCGHGGFFSRDFVDEFWTPYVESGKVKDSATKRPTANLMELLFSARRFSWTLLSMVAVIVIALIVAVIAIVFF